MADLTEEHDRANMQITDKIRKSAARTVDLMKRRKDLNDEIKNERDQMDKIGVHPRAYQDEIRNFKLYDESERAVYMHSRRVVTEALTGIEGDLFAEEISQRQERTAKKAKLKGNEGAPNPDTNPRSDPASGGAGRPSQEELSKAAADAEQKAGDAVLNAGLSQTKRSQSQIAADKLSDAKLN